MFVVKRQKGCKGSARVSEKFFAAGPNRVSRVALSTQLSHHDNLLLTGWIQGSQQSKDGLPEAWRVKGRKKSHVGDEENNKRQDFTERMQMLSKVSFRDYGTTCNKCRSRNFILITVNQCLHVEILQNNRQKRDNRLKCVGEPENLPDRTSDYNLISISL